MINLPPAPFHHLPKVKCRVWSQSSQTLLDLWTHNLRGFLKCTWNLTLLHWQNLLMPHYYLAIFQLTLIKLSLTHCWKNLLLTKKISKISDLSAIWVSLQKSLKNVPPISSSTILTTMISCSLLHSTFAWNCSETLHWIPHICWWHVAFNPRDPFAMENVLNKLSSCISEMRRWMAANYLKLNDSKTEFFYHWILLQSETSSSCWNNNRFS